MSETFEDGEPMIIIDTEGIFDEKTDVEKNDGKCLETIERSSSTPADKPKTGLAYRVMDFLFNGLEGEKDIDHRSITSCGGVMLDPGDGHNSLDMSKGTLRVGEMGVERGRVVTQGVDGIAQFVRCDHLRKGFRGKCSCALAHIGNDPQDTVPWKVPCVRRKLIEETGKDPAMDQI